MALHLAEKVLKLPGHRCFLDRLFNHLKVVTHVFHGLFTNGAFVALLPVVAVTVEVHDMAAVEFLERHGGVEKPFLAY